MDQGSRGTHSVRDGAVQANIERKGGTFIAARSDSSLTALDQSIVGASAKAATKLVLYPLDTWKARSQARSFGDLKEFEGLWTLRGLYRGFATKIIMYSPYQAVYMGVYVQARDRFVTAVPAAGVWTGALGCAAAGVVAELMASVVRLPMEVMKLRLQLGLYRNTMHALLDIVRHPSRVYGNFVPQTLLHDCCYSACAWLVFETSRQHLFALRGDAQLPAQENLALGTFTGAVSALVTTPLDVLKTRIVGWAGPGATQNGAMQSSTVSDGARRPGIVAVARTLLRDEGPRGFWRGAPLRVLHLAPSHGLYMLLYEAMKEQVVFWRGHS